MYVSRCDVISRCHLVCAGVIAATTRLVASSPWWPVTAPVSSQLHVCAAQTRRPFYIQLSVTGQVIEPVTSRTTPISRIVENMAPRTRSARNPGADPEQDTDIVPEQSSKQTTSLRKKDKGYRKENLNSEIKQLQFPARSTTVRPKKTYGKKQRRSLPPYFPPSTSNKSGRVKDEDPRQSTLTQIGWVPSTFPEDDDEIDPLEIDLTADGRSSDHGRAETKTTKQPRRKKTGGKRRKTTGDLELEPDEENEDDGRPRSSFYTQTLTQMPSWKQSGEEEDVDDMFVGTYDDQLERPVANTEEEFAATPPARKRKRPSPPPPKSQPPPPPSRSQGSAVLQTPAKQRMPPAEIPSSQPSPFTPNLAIERRGWSPLAEGTDRTPLKSRSTNVGAPTPSGNSRVLKRTRSHIPDSWSTVNGGMSSTPSTKRTPLKDITPWEETANASMDQVEPADDARTEGQDDMLQQKSQRPQNDVIIDSDDEFEMDEEQAGAPGTPTPVRPARTERIALEGVDSEPVELHHPTPLAEHVTTDTHASILEGTASLEALHAGNSSPTPFVSQKHPSYLYTRPIPDPKDPVEEDTTDPETPSQQRRRPSSSSVAEKETPLSSPQKTSPAMPPISQLGYKSQGWESQRVPYEVIRQMAPQTDRSDVILSIHPEHVKEITDGTKTHEFRNYKIPQTVARIWIYITRPVCQLKYMAIIGEAKLPGQISSDDLGIGNGDFNEGKGSKFAYELKQVYQLNNPVSLAQMKENGWVEEAPVRYVYVPPAVLGELMGNLQRALFLEPGEVQPTQVGVTISQELEEQLRTDIAHSTQLMRIASSPRPPSQTTKAGKVAGNGQRDVIVLSSSQDVDMEEDEEHIAETPARSKRATGRQVAFAQSTMMPSHSNSQLSLVEDSPPPPATMRASLQTQRKSAVRPSQATTASASSQSQRFPSQSQTHQSHSQRLRSRSNNNNNSSSSQQLSVPVSQSPLRKRTPEAMPTNRRSSSLPGPPIEEDDDISEVVDDSPVAPRARGRDDTQSTLGLGLNLSLGSSSQTYGLELGGEQDSLMDDSRIRKPPSEIAWDSDGEELE